MTEEDEWKGAVRYQWQCPRCRAENVAIDDELGAGTELECEQCGNTIPVADLQFFQVDDF